MAAYPHRRPYIPIRLVSTMTSTFRFGRIAGIEIGAHWTWLLVVALVVWSLAATVFPAATPDLATGTHVAMALAAAALFFASLLAHELGHALQARRDGVPIDGITLWVFGGVARFAGQPSTAASELRVALAGPVVSLAIGLAALGVAGLLPLSQALDGVVRWLGYINLFLLAFNLLPAFPLDGGRVVRALLWMHTDDLPRATTWAAGGGRAFATAMIVGGLVLSVLLGDLSGLWLALLGLFLLSAAEGELQLVRAQAALGGLRVGDVMVRDPVSVPADLPLDRFIDDVFMAHRHTAYPVVAAEPVGLVSFRDVLDVPLQDRKRLRVADRMLPLDRLLIVDADRDLLVVTADLARDDLHRALVRDHGRLAGLLSITDTARVLEALTDARAARRDAVPAPAAAPEEPAALAVSRR